MPNPEPSKTELAWLAGIVDGEGCLYTNWKNYSSGCRRLPQVALIIVNTDWRLISRVKDILHRIHGRTQAARLARVYSKKHNSAWHVRVQRRSALEKVLRSISPFMCNKKQRAEWALEMLSWRKRPGVEIPEWVLALANKIKHENNNPARPEGVETIGETVETEEIVQVPI